MHSICVSVVTDTVTRLYQLPDKEQSLKLCQMVVMVIKRQIQSPRTCGDND